MSISLEFQIHSRKPLCSIIFGFDFTDFSYLKGLWKINPPNNRDSRTDVLDKFWKIFIVGGSFILNCFSKEVCDFWNFHIIMRKCSIIKLQCYQNKSIHQKSYMYGCFMKFLSVLGWNVEKHWSLPLFTLSWVCRDLWNFHAGIFLFRSTSM